MTQQKTYCPWTSRTGECESLDDWHFGESDEESGENGRCESIKNK